MKYAQREEQEPRLQRIISSEAAISYQGDSLLSNASRRRYLGIAYDELISSDYSRGNRKIEAIAKKSGGVPRRQNQEAITRSIKSSNRRPGGVFSFTVTFRLSRILKTWSGTITEAANWVDAAAMILKIVEDEIRGEVISLDVS